MRWRLRERETNRDDGTEGRGKREEGSRRGNSMEDKTEEVGERDMRMG